MLLGKVTTVTDTANALSRVFAVMSSPKTPPALAAAVNATAKPTDNLDEVVVTAQKIATPAPPADDMPEIVVQAKRIQWWQWLLAGGAAYFLLSQIRKG